MTLTIYNSLTHTKEPFYPVTRNTVKMYVCGMTVYSDAHIGHARTYIAFDIIRRYLEYQDYHVTYIQNITDVDDKIIAASQREHIDPLAYSRRYTQRCLDDLAALGIRPADLYPKASDNIPDMITMIQQILANGYAYTADGDVYFQVDRFTDYGKLSGQKPDEMKTGARIEPGERKHNPLDFALWKTAKPGEPSWDSPWGKGRPGWHIECSAMSSKYLGLPFDIHGGGMDLRFPHHENEIAQAEAATGKPFARYWIHIGLLTINGEKMSKSLGNFITIRDLITKYPPEVIRIFFAQAHYRSPPDYTEKALSDTTKSLERLHRVKERLQECATPTNDELDTTTLQDTEKDYLLTIETLTTSFTAAMDDDFNTPKAFAALFDFTNKTNKYLENTPTPTPALCRLALKALLETGNVLTLFQETTAPQPQEDLAVTHALQTLAEQYQVKATATTTPELLNALLQARTDARKHKQWAIADGIRNDIEKLGYEIQDTDKGSVWRKR
jgi:cysteinyl-tRNA synthetase